MRRTKSIDELMEEWNQQESIDVERSVRCPECLSTMERMSIPNSNQIPQDICRKCDLIWCDPGEIQIHLLAFISSDKGGEAERFQRRHELMTDHQKEMLEARINNLPTDHFDLIGALANYRHPRMRL